MKETNLVVVRLSPGVTWCIEPESPTHVVGFECDESGRLTVWAYAKIDVDESDMLLGVFNPGTYECAYICASGASENSK